jgi:hypothetical protein
MRQHTLAKLKDLGYSSYNEYLASTLWEANKTRLRLGWSCFVCDVKQDLDAHHCSYDNVGNEQDGDLVMLCRHHHLLVHRLVRKKKLVLLTAHIDVRDGYLKRQNRKPAQSKTDHHTKKKPSTSAKYRSTKKGKKKTKPTKSQLLAAVVIENERLQQLQKSNRERIAERRREREAALRAPLTLFDLELDLDSALERSEPQR